MTPKEKAQELFNKMFSPPNCVISLHRQAGRTFLAKQCALIAVDELIESHLLLTTTHEAEPSIRCKTYWQEVKKEIELL
jgi:hypothetical protein